VKQTPNSIGYVELIYAVQQKNGLCGCKECLREIVKPSFTSVTAAAAAAKDMPDDFRVSITNGMGARYTDLLVHMAADPVPDQRRNEEESAHRFPRVDADHRPEGLRAVSYAQLPKAVVAKEQKTDRADQIAGF